MKKNFRAVLFLTLVIVIAVSYFVYDRISYKTDISLDNVKQIAQLASVEYKLKVSEVLDYDGNKIGPITIPGTKKFYISVIKGTVVAGVDLEKIKRIDVSRDKVVIYLPKAEILHVYTDPNSKFEKYYEGIFADITPEEITTLEKKANDDLVNEAKSDEILKKADVNVRKALSQLIKMAGIKTVEFK